MSDTTSFRALRVRREGGGFRSSVEAANLDSLPPGDVLVRVEYSAINYKDALSGTGAPGVTKEYPHTPGIDGAGQVVESTDTRFAAGDPVIVGGGDFGATRWGAYSDYVRVPADMLVHRPEGLSAARAMTIGTAGVTAAYCVRAILGHGIRGGDALVTGASGGVGSFAVSILAREGFSVTAVTGKDSAAEYLRNLGASDIISRQEAIESSDRPLLRSRWNAVVDTVGGAILASAIRSTARNGVVTACGNAASPDLPLTVFPFILRGVTLVGIDSPAASVEQREAAWRELSGAWQPPALDTIGTECTLEDLPGMFNRVLEGSVRGRMVVRVNEG